MRLHEFIELTYGNNFLLYMTTFGYDDCFYTVLKLIQEPHARPLEQVDNILSPCDLGLSPVGIQTPYQHPSPSS